MKYRKVPTRGRYDDRLLANRDNPREVAFADQWDRENDRKGFGRPVLDALIEDWTNRDAEVAATLIQWLGSNVGFSFLEESLVKCGYSITYKEQG